MRRGCRRVRYAFFLVVWRPNGLSYNRLGVTASRKVAGAVGRNRIKRLVREAFRLTADRQPTGMDINVIAHKGADSLKLCDVQTILRDAYSEMTQAAGPGSRPRV